MTTSPCSQWQAHETGSMLFVLCTIYTHVYKREKERHQIWEHIQIYIYIYQIWEHIQIYIYIYYIYIFVYALIFGVFLFSFFLSFFLSLFLSFYLSFFLSFFLSFSFLLSLSQYIMSTSRPISSHYPPTKPYKTLSPFSRDLRDADIEDEPENNSSRGAWSQSFKKKFMRAGSMKMMSRWAFLGEGAFREVFFFFFSMVFFVPMEWGS